MRCGEELVNALVILYFPLYHLKCIEYFRTIRRSILQKNNKNATEGEHLGRVQGRRCVRWAF